MHAFFPLRNLQYNTVPQNCFPNLFQPFLFSFYLQCDIVFYSGLQHPIEHTVEYMIQASFAPFFQNKKQDLADTFLQIHILIQGMAHESLPANLTDSFSKENYSYFIVLYYFAYNLQSCFYLCFQTHVFLKLCFRYFCVLMSSICFLCHKTK